MCLYVCVHVCVLCAFVYLRVRVCACLCASACAHVVYIVIVTVDASRIHCIIKHVHVQVMTRRSILCVANMHVHV